MVAPKTLRRDYLGVVVPDTGVGDTEGRLPRLASRLILRGLHPDAPDLTEVTTCRAEALWRAAGRMRVVPRHVRYNG